MTPSRSQAVIVVADGDASVRRALTADFSKAGFLVVAFSDDLSTLKYFAIGERADVLVTGTDRGAGDKRLSMVVEARRQRPDLQIVTLPRRASRPDPTWVARIMRAVQEGLRSGRRMTASQPSPALTFITVSA